MEELKPCPFCNGEAYTTEDIDRVFCWSVYCIECDCKTGNYEAEKEAIDAWNKRA